MAQTTAGSTAVRRAGRGARARWGLAVAAGVAGVLTLTGCTDDGDSGDAGASGSPGAASSGPGGSGPSASASASGGTSGTPAGGGELAGSWLTTSGGHAVALVVTGDKAALFATGGSVCSGTASGDAIRLKCTDGSDDRADGTVESVGENTLKVSWRGGPGEETYTRSEGGSLPPGLPTAGPAS
ncbi:hypothetical protein ACGFZL_03365 [Streptomyces sp. NPDC048182]|uniref:hypothetical protein n=1 Tax=Streptomyces sp. NPDC048182 TaxID=3365507 RepID=UPI0037108DCD